MNAAASVLRKAVVLAAVAAVVLLAPAMQLHPRAQAASAFPLPVVAIHVSELTRALESMPAKPPTPATRDDSGYEWWPSNWHYFPIYEALKEALRSDGTPFVEVSDADIQAGLLISPDGPPRYPIVISLAAEAIADAEIAPLRDYVSAGGFLLVGASAMTRRPDGTSRGDFALATEMGLHQVTPSLLNWGESGTFSKVVDHQLVTGFPSGALTWHMPLGSEEIPWGVSPTRKIDWQYYLWPVRTAGATVIANASSSPVVTTKTYGRGTFIYNGAMEPVIANGGAEPGTFSYLIFRNAIEWAFKTAGVPIVRVSPWRFQYDAAFIVRHDFENFADMIRAIESSAAFEKSKGAKGEYYFCTGTLREQMSDKTTVIASLKRAVTNSGATIGSHNGGLKNPVNLSLAPADYEYFHWGPDEALDTRPSGYASGQAYASSSISTSFQDLAGWLAGVDNGRAGCGSQNTCPRTWVSPFYNGVREGSYTLLEQLNAITLGEQKVGPFPHWTVSTQTPGKRFAHLSVPVSEWWNNTTIRQSLEDHTSASMRSGVDFYYGLGALINFYGHAASASGSVQGDYVTYVTGKSRVWAANSVALYDWWRLRSPVTVASTYTTSGDFLVVNATISGATDANTAVDIVLPSWNPAGQVQVLLDGRTADPSVYRTTSSGLKIKVGATTSGLEVHYSATPGAPMTITPSPVAFGSQTVGTSADQTVTLANGSSAVVALNDLTITGTNSGDFTWANVTCGDSLAVGASCQVKVTFKPLAAGARSATMSLYSTASGSPHTASLTGTGVTAGPIVSLSATSLAFGNQTVATTSAAKPVTLSNTGTAALTIASIAVGGTNAGDFAQANTCGSSVAAGGSCTINVTFKPTAAGSRVASVTVTDNATGSPHAISVSGTGVTAAPAVSLSATSLAFASQTVGTTSAAQSVTLTNTGTAALGVTSITVSGTNAGDFAQTNTCGTSVAAGGTCSIAVTFTPTVAASRTASVTIADNAAGSPHAITLSGTGVTAGPAVSLSATSLAFGNQSVGTTSTARTVTLSNTGTSALSITSIALAGANSGDFAQTNTCGATVAAGGTCTISVTFRPTATGSRTASVTIVDNASGSPHGIALTGTGVAAGPFLTITPSPMSFGSQAVGTTSSPMSLTLTNTGGAALALWQGSLTGANTGDFGFTGTNCPGSLAVGASCTVTFTFTPGGSGARSATFVTTSNATNSPTNVVLSGTGF